jgi:hypothetical protein
VAAEQRRGQHQHHGALRRAALPLLALTLAAGCTTGPLLERAIAARGGPLPGVVLRAETEVHAGVPGRWRYTRAFLAPDRYGWRILTTGEPQTHLFDGTVVRSFVGGAEVSRDAGPGAPLRSHARWTAVVSLDALRLPGVAVAPLPAEALPDGTAAGLTVSFPDGAVYRLGFDRRPLLQWAEGPLDLSPLGSGRVRARFGDYRRAGPLLLPFAAEYRLDDLPIADETIEAACVAPVDLTPESFRDPDLLPVCE